MDNELIKEVAGYIATSSDIINGLIEKTAALETELRAAREAKASEPEVQQKTAAEILTAEEVAGTVGKMVQAGMFKAADRQAVESQIRTDPAVLLKCLDKVADEKIRATVTPIGQPVDKPTRNSNTAGTRKSDEAYEQRFGNP